MVDWLSGSCSAGHAPSSAEPEPRACTCPTVHGVIRHEREWCTDPVVIRLDWFPV